MSIYKYKNGWKAEIWIDMKRITGKSGFLTKGDAKKWYDTTMAQYHTDPAKLTRPKEHTFDDLLERFILVHLPTVAEGTRVRYLLDINRRIRDNFRFLPLEKVTKSEIELFRARVPSFSWNDGSAQRDGIASGRSATLAMTGRAESVENSSRSIHAPNEVSIR